VAGRTHSGGKLRLKTASGYWCSCTPEEPRPASTLQQKERIGAPIILGRCPSLSAHESESMLRTYFVCREKQEREKNKQTAGRSTQCTNNSDPIGSTCELLEAK
jgi:hypothetical protein